MPTLQTMRRALLILAALAVTGALTACGVRSTVDPVAAAATKSEKAGGYKLTMTTKMSAAGVNGSITAQGTFDGQAGQMDMDMSDLLKSSGAPAGTDATMSAIFLKEDGDPVMYMRFGFLAGQLPAGKTWLRIDMQKAGKGLGVDFNQLTGGAAQNPTSALDLLRSSSDFSEVGKETIDGVQTTHYHGIVDLEKAAAAGGAASAAIQRLGATGQTPIRCPLGSTTHAPGFPRWFTPATSSQAGLKPDTTMDNRHDGLPLNVDPPRTRGGRGPPAPPQALPGRPAQPRPPPPPFKEREGFRPSRSNGC